MIARKRLMLICLALMGGSLAISFSLAEPPAGHGAAHAGYPSMNEGGDANRHHNRLLLGWIFGSAHLALSGCCLALGIKPKRPWTLLLFMLSFIAVFSLLVWSYSTHVGPSDNVLGFRPATAWLVYGIWPIGFLLTIGYVVWFGDWVFDDNDQKRFDEIVAKQQRMTRQNPPPKPK